MTCCMLKYYCSFEKIVKECVKQTVKEKLVEPEKNSIFVRLIEERVT